LPAGRIARLDGQPEERVGIEGRHDVGSGEDLSVRSGAASLEDPLFALTGDVGIADATFVLDGW
jgi:hypothetical protein